MLREILNDEALNDYVFNNTGKHLAVINAGAQITTPAAKISFIGGTISTSTNTVQHVNYSVSFALPFWGADAFSMCHDFLDVAVEAFSNHELRAITGRKNYITNINPSIKELDAEKNFWTVDLIVTVSIFI